MRIGLAFRAFFAALFNASLASEIESVLAGDRTESPPAPSEPKKDQSAGRSDAIALLESLQREARFVDIVNEPLEGYTDAQIGAASRDVLRQCGEVLDRMFGLQPVVPQSEGEEIETPPNGDEGRFRLTGNVVGQPPYRGSLMHQGWEATRCELPKWTGSEQTELVIAPAELELK